MQVPIGWLSDRFNLRWLYAACFALWSVTCGLTGFAASLGVLLLLRVLLGIGESIYLPGGMKIVSILFPPKDRGLASGLVNCGTRAGLAFGAPLIAAVVVAFGWQNAFFILGFTSLVWLIPWIAAFPRGANTAEYGEPGAAKATWGKVDRNLLGMSITNIGYGYYFYLMVTWLPTYLVQARHLPLKIAAAYVVVPYVTFAVSEPIGGWIADRLVAHRLGGNLRAQDDCHRRLPHQHPAHSRRPGGEHEFRRVFLGRRIVSGAVLRQPLRDGAAHQLRPQCRLLGWRLQSRRQHIRRRCSACNWANYR